MKLSYVWVCVFNVVQMWFLQPFFGFLMKNCLLEITQFYDYCGVVVNFYNWINIKLFPKVGFSAKSTI